MPEFSSVGQRFRQRMRTLGGSHFFGHISPAPEGQGRGNQFFTPRRILKTHPSCNIVTSGTIIVDAANRKLLAGWNGEMEFHGVYCQTFKLYDLDRYLSWRRAVTVADPVTGQPRESAEQELGPIWSTLELMNQDTDSLRSPASRYRVLCNADLQIGDTINSAFTVRRVEAALGIVIAEVE